jgi:bifunctional non-homologous end joining protein LigD
MPDKLAPMLAESAEAAFDKAGWVWEPKLDGYRVLAFIDAKGVRLKSRKGLDLADNFPKLVAELAKQEVDGMVLDGELVAFDADGKPSFERLQQRMHQTEVSVVRRRMKSHPVVYVVFDLLYFDGHDLTGQPYERRREVLEGLELDGESWRTPGYSVGHAAELLEASRAQGLEGMVLKRLDSPYAPGKRTGAWLKVKNTLRQELVIGGWTPGEGRRKAHLGALLVGYFEGEGAERTLRYGGKIGTGFKQADLEELAARLAPLSRKTSPFEVGAAPPKNAHFVTPQLVAEFEFRELTREGMVRHGAYKGLREDKPAAEVELERPA